MLNIALMQARKVECFVHGAHEILDVLQGSYPILEAPGSLDCPRRHLAPSDQQLQALHQ